MQIRCSNCHKPYALPKEAVYAALDQMKAEKLSHYATSCPHCRRTNKISANELNRAAPDWGARPAAEEENVQDFPTSSA